MCGIAGFTRFNSKSMGQPALKAMADAIAHRGPDAEGFFETETIALAHRRLSIIDLSEAGTQPLHTKDGTLSIVFNGEIYNYRELREALIADGVAFSTATDTEVILELYRRHGERCLDLLNGMFAFALWDDLEQRVFIARDRLGKKPLYYAEVDGDLVFASELSALVASGAVAPEIRDDALHDYLAYQYVPAPKSLLNGVFKLPPAHYLIKDAHTLSIARWWTLSHGEDSNSDESAAQLDLKSLIEDSTSRRMIADVPLGAFLSGGVDSSGVVATMAASKEREVITCTVGFTDESLDETRYAQEIADAFQTTHYTEVVQSDVRSRLGEILSFLDEPLADPSVVPTFFVSELARKHVTVALAGDGGDELFAGYEKYLADARENRVRSLTPQWVRRHVLSPVATRLENSRVGLLRRISSFLASIAMTPAAAFYRSNTQLTDQQWDAIAQPSLKARLGDYHPAQVTIDAYGASDAKDHLSKILDVDLNTWLPGDILMKADRMSMAHALEVRAPLLDYRIAEFAARLSPRLKLRGKEKKFILRNLFLGILPKSIVNRKKMGFTPPLSQWLREDLRDIVEDRLIRNPRLVARYFQSEHVKLLWGEHSSGLRDHGYLLWSLLVLEFWWENMIRRSTESRAVQF